MTAAVTEPRRAFVVVVDALGAGAEPDAADYGDAGANTLLNLARAAGGLKLPALQSLGLGNIMALPGVAPSPDPSLHGVLSHQGPGKDSTSGHWELFGVVMERSLPAFPAGLPPQIVEVVEQAFGGPVCCARAIDGITAIDEYGEHHLSSGEPILYTSVDSVVQIAAHEDVLAPEALYRACERARALLTGDLGVGRVIARPFAGTAGDFTRTAGRRDYSLEPPSPSYLEAVCEAGVPVHCVGKVGDLFARRGVEQTHPGASNAEAIDSLDGLIAGLDRGLVVVNLVDTDQVYGHRKDIEGFHRALREIDTAVAAWLEVLGEGDLLVLTADHGVDPAARHHDHTRERVPLLAWYRGVEGRRHEGPMADVGASALHWCAARRRDDMPGRPFC